MKRSWVTWGQGAAGLLVGLMVVEGAFWVRDGGAFPHLNCYLPDADLGLRLEPGATQRVSFSDNPVHSIRINESGFRGAALPPRTDREIVVVGDSQVFGLGVEEDETFAAGLARATGRTVINAGVPTYGPPEYAAVAMRIVEERKPETVIFTVNFVNDLFEWNAPNRERHTEWDGWAVRAETAPAAVFQFPGRRTLMRRSHAIFAWRSLQARSSAAGPGAEGFPSEGSWTDLVNPERLVASGRLEGAPRDQTLDPSEVERELEAVQATISAEVVAAQQEGRHPRRIDAQLMVEAAAGHPGDIVSRDLAEESREIAVTARLMRQGAVYRARVMERLVALDNERARAVEAAVARDAQLRNQRQAIARETLNRRYDRSVLTPLLRKLRDDCEQHGVELVVVALPIDVQVSDREWEKYPEAEPVDMGPSMVLLDDLVEDVHALGVRAVNVTEALRNAEPGAFLYGDIHMTPTGHAAVATAVAAVLEEPPPLRLPSTGLAAGRTWIPRHQDWLRTPERTVRGSSRARCETVQLKEWLSVSCQRVDGRRPTGVTVHEGDHGEARVTRTSESVTLVTPLFVGEPFRATFHWESYGQELTASWLESEEPEIAFGARQPEHGRRLEVSELEGRLCECARAVRPESRCVTEGDPLEPDDVGRHVTSYVRDCEETCAHLAGGNLTACDATHPNDCEQYLACAEGSLGALPACGSGEIAVGGAGTCKVACDGRHPCPNGGACRPWQGAGYCE